MNNNINNELSLIINDYDSFPSFISKYKELSIIEYNYYSVNDLSLFFLQSHTISQKPKPTYYFS